MSDPNSSSRREMVIAAPSAAMLAMPVQAAVPGMEPQTTIPTRGERTVFMHGEPHNAADQAFEGIVAPGSPDSAELRILNDLRNALGHDREAARSAALRLVTLLTVAVTRRPDNKRGGLAPWQQQKIEVYMRQNLGDQLRLSELADQVSLSVSHFCRAFKESLGATPHQHLTSLRLERAQKLMLGTAEPLSQIAVACGFADQAHLSKLFRRVLGDSPAAWRRTNRTNAAPSRCGSDSPRLSWTGYATLAACPSAWSGVR